MPRTISNEQREQLFQETSDMETAIADLESLAVVLDRIAECAKSTMDGDAVRLVAGEICRRATDLTNAHDTLFHGLHESATSREEAIARLAAKYGGQS